jgi:hypothetical protein
MTRICVGGECEGEIYLKATEKGKITRLKQIIAARVLESKDAQPLSKILRTGDDRGLLPVEVEIAVRELMQEGLVEESI